ncbi:MAG: sugar phosphate isomerase/epimerase family protein, partial [Terriglobia bacterium]
MGDKNGTGKTALDRRNFFKTAGMGLAAAGVILTPREEARAQADLEKLNLERIAANSYGVRNLFKERPYPGRGPGAAGRGERSEEEPNNFANDPNAAGPLAVAKAAEAARAKLPTPEEQKAKYGEITLLDFPQFAKDTFPGVTHMDLYSGFFGDVADDSMYFPEGSADHGFDPLSPSGRKWLDRLANVCVKTGMKVQHISNNAPTNLAEYGSPEKDALRKAGVAMGNRWIEGLSVLGVKSMRMNSPRALGPPIRPNAVLHGPGDGYPRNIDIVPMMAAAIESYKAMADVGGNYGIRVTLENHWGLAADPINIRTIVDEINHPYCEASPDFGNWEQEYMLVNGLMALAPYAHTNVHAKYWDRWGDKNNVQRSTRIMLASG